MQFSRKNQKQTNIENDVEEIPEDGLSKNQFVQNKIVFQAVQSVGKGRTNNEDMLFAQSLTYQKQDVLHSLGVFIVADGMGGHSNGELASKYAVEAAWSSLSQPLNELILEESDGINLPYILTNAVALAQEAVLQKVPSGGTTLTIALVLDEKIAFAHVGDSRLYIIEDFQEIKPLTRDHSLVSRLVDLGQISPAEAEVHPQRNVLFRALGQTEGFKADFGELEIAKPCMLLLCSDGLWGQVHDSEIMEILSSHQFSLEAVEDLANAANRNGGADNISAILVKIY